MGQSSSTVPPKERRKSIGSSLRSPFPRRARKNKGILSATFNYVEPDMKIEQINVNTATEEELMTLPGVNRVTARNIVEYKQAIGRFNKVEDLALVSGIGADKLNLIRPEICVHRKKHTGSSNTSSRAQSQDSLSSIEEPSCVQPCIDVNTANVFSLMAVRGIDQELAANIVDYRDRKGPFHVLEDLLKVRGMTSLLLSTLRHRLVASSPSLKSPPLSAGKNIQNGYVLSKSPPQINSKLSGDRRPQSNGHLQVKDLFDLLCAYSHRPVTDEVFNNCRNGRKALRIASWNLHAMTLEKVENPGVREVLCRTLLENRFSLIAVQEVSCVSVLEKLCDELNDPKLRRVAEWKGTQGKWKCMSPSADNKEMTCGLIYDCECGLSLRDTQTLQHDKDAVALLAHFQMGSTTVSVLNLQVHKVKTSLDVCSNFFGKIKPDIVLGDFSSAPDAEFTEDGYMRILAAPTVTNSVPGSNNMYSDNIYLHKNVVSRYTGVSGILRQGLTHLAIPRGWSWGGPASEHCPVWCELYT